AMEQVAAREAAKESNGARHSGRAEPALAVEEQHDPVDSGLGRVLRGTPAGAPPPEVGRLLAGASLAHPANQGVRTVALRRAQQAYGNRVAQRLVPRACACGGTCERCASTTTRLVQARDAGTGGPEASLRAEDVTPRDSHGEALDEETRQFMEARFGTSFEHVRLHTDSST